MVCIKSMEAVGVTYYTKQALHKCCWSEKYLSSILRPTSNRSPYILKLVLKVKHRAYTIHAFINIEIPCRNLASYSI